MSPRFYLLGQIGVENPSAISREQIEKWEKQGFITYLGLSSDVVRQIRQCDCVVLPSFYKEGVPRVLLEALACAKPIITSDIAGAKECVAPPLVEQNGLKIGQNGILVPPKNAEKLKNAIELLANMPTLMQQMGANGREFVAKRFNIKRIIGLYSGAVAREELQDSKRGACEKAQDLQKNLKATQDLSNVQDSHKARLQDLQKNADSNNRLAFVSNTAFGMLNFRLPVLLALQQDGYEIHIIAPQDNHSKILESYGFFTHHLPLSSRSLNPLKDLKSALELRKLLKKIKPRLSFNYTIKPVIYGSFVAGCLKVPSIAIITGLGYVFIDGGIKKKILRKMVCLMYFVALFKAREVWFLNEDDKNEFINKKIIKASKARNIDSEGVDLEAFCPESKGISKDSSGANQSVSNSGAGLKDSSGVKLESSSNHSNPAVLAKNEIIIENKPVKFLLIARMLWDKGVGEFVEVAKMFANDNGGGQLIARFYLLGQVGVENPSAISREQVAEWEKRGFVTYLGVSSDVAEQIRQCDCVVLPSYREGVPLSLLEALACGKPIITSNAIGCKSVVQDGINGFVCEVKSVDSLKMACEKFIALNSKQKAQMAQNALKTAQEKYDIKRIIELYRQVVSGF